MSSEEVGRISSAPRTDLWEGMDKARAKTGGWWNNMKTLRLRIFCTSASPDEAGVFEVNIKFDKVQGVRWTTPEQSQLHPTSVPQVLWSLQEFMEYLWCIEKLRVASYPEMGRPPVVLEFSWEVWDLAIYGATGVWCGPRNGYQRALDVILEKFS